MKYVHNQEKLKFIQEKRPNILTKLIYDSQTFCSTLRFSIKIINGNRTLEMLASLRSSSSFTRAFSRIDAGITQVAKDVMWIGVNDYDLREFHSMESPVGTSYNSYLLGNDTVVDSVKYTLSNQWIERLKTVGGDDLKGIKHIVMNHAEPDHSSGLPQLLAAAPHIELVCTQMNLNTLKKFYGNFAKKVRIVKSGEPFKVGGKELILQGVPMAHWPESAVTYWPERKILFSNDAFGQHIATTQRFLDEIDLSLYKREAKSYYANILMRHGRPVMNALKAAASLPGIDMILPSHGVGFRRPEDIKLGIELYTRWAQMKPLPKLTVLYDCNWFGTEKMAQAIAAGASHVNGVDIEMLHARRTHITRTASEVLDSAAIAVGSAVLHENVLPDLAMHIQYLRCLNIKNKAGAIFGTYGWSPKTLAKEIRSQLFLPTKVEEVAEPIVSQWHPSSDDLERCEELGKKLAEVALEKGSK